MELGVLNDVEEDVQWAEAESEKEGVGGSGEEGDDQKAVHHPLEIHIPRGVAVESVQNDVHVDHNHPLGEVNLLLDSEGVWVEVAISQACNPYRRIPLPDHKDNVSKNLSGLHRRPVLHLLTWGIGCDYYYQWENQGHQAGEVGGWGTALARWSVSPLLADVLPASKLLKIRTDAHTHLLAGFHPESHQIIPTKQRKKHQIN